MSDGWDRLSATAVCGAVPPQGWDVVETWQKGLFLDLRSENLFEGNNKYSQGVFLREERS